MNSSRRVFLELAVPAAFAVALPVVGAQSQQDNGKPMPPHLPPPPDPAKYPHPEIEKVTPDPHAVLEVNQKNIKKDIQRLVELAQELKTEVEKTDAAEVLNLGMIHKAEEIEKLAHKIQTMARG